MIKSGLKTDACSMPSNFIRRIKSSLTKFYVKKYVKNFLSVFLSKDTGRFLCASCLTLYSSDQFFKY